MIFFNTVTGLVFMALAFGLFFMPRERRRALPFDRGIVWFSLFAFTQGVGEWTDAFSHLPDATEKTFLHALAFGSLSLSSLFLLVFGLTVLSPDRWKSLILKGAGVLFLLVFCLFLAFGGLGNDVTFFVRFFLALPAFALVTAALIRQVWILDQRGMQGATAYLIVMAASMTAYAFFSLNTDHGGWLDGQHFNAAGLLMEILRAGSILILASCMIMVVRHFWILERNRRPTPPWAFLGGIAVGLFSWVFHVVFLSQQNLHDALFLPEKHHLLLQMFFLFLFSACGAVTQHFVSRMMIGEEALSASEKRRRQSETTYRTLLETAADAILVMDADSGLILDANIRAGELLGRSPADLVGKNQGLLFADGHGKEQLLFSVPAGGLPRRMELVASDGSKLPVEVSASVVSEGDRRLLLGIFRDIREGLEREEGLRASEQQLSEMERVAQLGSWSWNARKNSVSLSLHFCRMLGAAPGNFDGGFSSFLQLAHSDDRLKLEKALYRCLVEKNPCRERVRFKHFGGGYRIMQVNAEAVLGSRVAAEGVAGMAQDITEQALAKDSLLALSSTFSALSGREFFTRVSRHLAEILDVYSVFVGELSGGGEQVRVLGGALAGQDMELFRYDLAGTPCERVMEKSFCHYAKGVQRLFPEDKQLEEMAIESYIGSPLYDKQGEVLGIMVLLDTKPLMQPNQADMLFKIFSEKVVAEILRGRAEDRLRDSVAEKERLLCEVHHRVKNNLQVIHSLLSLQARNMEIPAAQEVFRATMQRIRAMALIHEKLYRADNLATIDFGDYIKSLAREIARSYGVSGKDISLVLDVAAVDFDLDTAIPCGLIVSELVANAYKHGFATGVTGTIRVALKRLNDFSFRIRVEDDGGGIAADVQEAKEGIGLQLVRDLAERQLHGDIVFERQDGKTRFAVTFPLQKKLVNNS